MYDKLEKYVTLLVAFSLPYWDAFGVVSTLKWKVRHLKPKTVKRYSRRYNRIISRVLYVVQ
jgi:hypothetical protein